MRAPHRSHAHVLALQRLCQALWGEAPTAGAAEGARSSPLPRLGPGKRKALDNLGAIYKIYTSPLPLPPNSQGLCQVCHCPHFKKRQFPPYFASRVAAVVRGLVCVGVGEETPWFSLDGRHREGQAGWEGTGGGFRGVPKGEGLHGGALWGRGTDCRRAPYLTGPGTAVLQVLCRLQELQGRPGTRGAMPGGGTSPICFLWPSFR